MVNNESLNLPNANSESPDIAGSYDMTDVPEFDAAEAERQRAEATFKIPEQPAEESVGATEPVGTFAESVDGAEPATSAAEPTTGESVGPSPEEIANLEAEVSSLEQKIQNSSAEAEDSLQKLNRIAEQLAECLRALQPDAAHDLRMQYDRENETLFGLSSRIAGLKDELGTILTQHGDVLSDNTQAKGWQSVGQAEEYSATLRRQGNENADRSDLLRRTIDDVGDQIWRMNRGIF